MDRDAQNVDAIKTKGVTLLLRDIDSSNLKLNPLRFAILSFCFVSLTFVIITIITILSHNCTLFPFAMCLMFCQATVATEEHSNSDNEEEFLNTRCQIAIQTQFNSSLSFQLPFILLVICYMSYIYHCS